MCMKIIKTLICTFVLVDECERERERFKTSFRFIISRFLYAVRIVRRKRKEFYICQRNQKKNPLRKMSESILYMCNAAAFSQMTLFSVFCCIRIPYFQFNIRWILHPVVLYVLQQSRFSRKLCHLQCKRKTEN